MPAVAVALRKANSLRLRVVIASFRIGSRLLSWVGFAYVALRFPALGPGIREYSRNGGKGDIWQYRRVMDLARLISRRQPNHIVELGSGVSTLAFKHFAKERGARVSSFESDRSWAEVTVRACSTANVSPDFIFADRLVAQDGVYYATPIPSDADFIYVDGPDARVEGRLVPCIDVLHALEAGIRPATIIVSQRHATVSALCSFNILREEYDFLPSADYSLERRNLMAALLFRRHTQFLKKAAVPA